LTGNSGHSVAAILQISAIVNAKARQLDLASGDAETAALEADIDRASDAPPPLCDFISAGEAEASARLHMARAVARRTEHSSPRLISRRGRPPRTLCALSKRRGLSSP
jgi:cob(I)alamin adenosyltransferase